MKRTPRSERSWGILARRLLKQNRPRSIVFAMMVKPWFAAVVVFGALLAGVFLGFGVGISSFCRYDPPFTAVISRGRVQAVPQNYRRFEAGFVMNWLIASPLANPFEARAKEIR